LLGSFAGFTQVMANGPFKSGGGQYTNIAAC